MPFTEQGYHRLTYDEWLQTDIARAKRLFGESIDISENTPLGKYIRLNCEDKRDLEEEMEEIYLSYNYQTARGEALRALCRNVGVAVSPGVAAQHSIVIAGTVEYQVPAGFSVTTEDRSVTFHTINDCVIGSGGIVTTTVECDELGTAGNVDAGAINTVTYTNANVTGISGSIITLVGEDAESDVSARRKYATARNALGSGTYSAIIGALYQVDGVKAACCDYNNTMDDISGGLPAKTYHVSVLAASSLQDSIAEAIFSKAPLLTESVGEVSVQVEDEWGRQHTIKFDWMTEKLIYVYVQFLVDSDWSDASVTEAKEAIEDHINALPNNTTVYRNDIYTCLKGVTGKVNVEQLKIGTSAGSLSENDISVSTTEIAKTSTACIVVETVSV